MKKVFRQRRNDANDIKAIADDYETRIGHPLWLVDGLQKDAIQNSWDARIDKKHGKNWECGFTLIEVDDIPIVCIEDRGTTGLDGTKFNNDEELSEVLNNDKSREDLAYFLNSNWSIKSSDEGGNRGRGKTLFLISSKKKIIFFDSLRSSDNDYVCGKLYLDGDKQIKFELYYSDEARNFLKEYFNNAILPIDHHGTRIFIIDPDPLIIETIKNGEILSFISHSRWETIKKYKAKIFSSYKQEKKYAELPKWYEDDIDFKSKVFSLEKIKDHTDYRIKRMVLVYAPNSDIPEAIKGISIQRGGMSIQRINASDLVHEEGMNDIYGWVEMDELLEKDMKEIEGPEHFDFKWIKNPAKDLKNYIGFRVREFAKDLKIISSEEARQNKIQKTAEENASKTLGPFFKKLGLLGRIKGKSQKNIPERKENEQLRLSMADIKLPNENKRINYGQKISNAYVIPVNELSESILVLVRLFIVSDDGKNKIIEEKEINLSKENGPKIGLDKIVIDQDNFSKGSYSLKGRMIALEKKDWKLSNGIPIEKGTILYERTVKFYVETEPPEHGPFIFQPEKKDEKTQILRWEPQEDSGYKIFYNELHPRIRMVLDDTEKLSNYLTEQGALIALQIRLEEFIAEESGEIDSDLKTLVKTGDISKVWPTFLNKYSEFIWNINNKNGN